MQGKRVLFVIPTYNESGNVERLAGQIFQNCPEGHILFVDDASPDGTGERIRELMECDQRIHLLSRPFRGGLGTAYVEGFRYALREGYDLVFEMDADLSHDPSDIPLLLQGVEGADMVIGSRYVRGGGIEGWSLPRFLMSCGGSLFSRIALSIPIRDMTGGFKCMRREVLDRIDLDGIRSRGFAFQVEFTFKAWMGGAGIREVPVKFRGRGEGRSKMSFRIFVEGLFTVMRLRFETLSPSLSRRWYRGMRDG